MKIYYTIDQNHINLKDYEGLTFSCHVERCNVKGMNVWQYDNHLGREYHELPKKVRRPFIMHQSVLYLREKELSIKPGKRSSNSDFVRKYERK